jgi:hypothetical protein
MLSVEEMANRLFADRDASPVGKRWAINLVERQPDPKTRFQRRSDYKRAKCEDPTVIRDWFKLVQNTIAKYSIRSDDIYNFDETGFMMGMMSSGIVITSVERHGKPKLVQPGNREWVTVLQSYRRSVQKVGQSSHLSLLRANITLLIGTKKATFRATGLLPRPKMAGQIMRRASSG